MFAKQINANGLVLILSVVFHSCSSFTFRHIGLSHYGTAADDIDRFFPASISKSGDQWYRRDFKEENVKDVIVSTPPSSKYLVFSRSAFIHHTGSLTQVCYSFSYIHYRWPTRKCLFAMIVSSWHAWLKAVNLLRLYVWAIYYQMTLFSSAQHSQWLLQRLITPFPFHTNDVRPDFDKF